MLTIFKLYFSHPFCKKGLGLPAENTHNRLQRWRPTYRSSLLIVQWNKVSVVMEMASFCLKIRHVFADTSLTERSIGAGPPVIIQLSGQNIW
jgi:hypothetical protein